MKRSCNNTSLASIARIKSLLYFYLFKQQMRFLKELNRKPNWPEIAQNGTLGPQNYYCIFWEAPHTPPGEWPPSHTYPDLGLGAKMAAPPPFLVPAIATIVLAISNLNKNPDSSTPLPKISTAIHTFCFPTTALTKSSLF